MVNKFKEGLNKEQIKNSLANLKQVTFEVTDYCNLNCKYCGYGKLYEDYEDRKCGHLSAQKGIILFDYLADFWRTSRQNSYTKETFISFYGGEPLLNMEFIRKMVSYIENIKGVRKDFLFSMTTNAMLLDVHIKYLVDKNFKLLISLDGNEYNHSYRETHSEENSFKKVFSNINLLKDHYPEYFENNVNINAVLHNRNSVTDIYSFIKDNFDKTPRISELNTTGIKQDQQKLFEQMYQNKNKSLFNSKLKNEIQNELFIESPQTAWLGIFLHQYSGNAFHTYSDLLLSDKTEDLISQTGTCIPFSKKLFLTASGKILPCERIGHQYALGEVSDFGVDLDFDAIVNKFNHWYEKLQSQCTKCYNAKACMQCMFNIDDLDSRPKCNGFMNKKEFHKYCQDQMDYLKDNPHLYKRIMEEVLYN